MFYPFRIRYGQVEKGEDSMSLELLVADMQQRFGYQAFCRAAELAPARDTLPTGMRAADELLDGGLLAGATHCISGEPTSGATSLFYQAVAGAQAQDVPVVYLDMGGLLDPPNAAAAGVELERLLLLSRTPLKQALFLIRSLAGQRLPCLLALDHPPATPLAQLKAILRDAPLTLLALSPGALPGPLGGGEYGYRARENSPDPPSRLGDAWFIRKNASGAGMPAAGLADGRGRCRRLHQRTALDRPSLPALSASAGNLRYPAGGSMFSALVIQDLAATIERLHQPKLAGRPLVIVSGEHQLKVLATDQQAREAGVRIGDRRAQAELHCPEATLLRARDEVYRRLFADVSADLARHIDKVESGYQPGQACWIVSSDHPDELDILRRRIECLLGGTVSIGTGSGKFVAQVAGTSGTAHCRVAPGDEAAFLAPFPTALLPLNADMQRRLPLMGIRRIGDFAALSRAAVFEQWERRGPLLS